MLEFCLVAKINTPFTYHNMKIFTRILFNNFLTYILNVSAKKKRLSILKSFDKTTINKVVDVQLKRKAVELLLSSISRTNDDRWIIDIQFQYRVTLKRFS